jgi:hyperosmotically inducible periplasmic protein
MKRTIRIITSASVASALAFVALAQETTSTAPGAGQNADQTSASSTRPERLSGVQKTSDLIGMEIKNNQDEKLGKVEELAVDMESGRIVYAILSTGGFLGVGKTLHALPPGVFRPDVANKVFRLNSSQAELNAAPKFELGKWSQYWNSNDVATVYRQYGQKPYEYSPQHGGAATGSQPGIQDRDHIVSQNETYESAAPLSNVQKASKVVGMPVKNLQDEKLGKVENLIVDLPAGRIVAAIISSGGFIGLGNELSAVPPTVLQFTPDHSTLQLDASKEMLSASPHFKSNEWPDFTQPGYASDIYRAYRVQPYFAYDPTTDTDNTRRNVRDRDQRTPEGQQPDNTERNVRDRQDQTLTPPDQSNSKADVATTTQIRKEITATKNISSNAKNVKIITINGQVTLRGPVKTAEEKQLLGEIAARHTSSGKVDNQLEVQPPSDNKD